MVVVVGKRSVQYQYGIAGAIGTCVVVGKIEEAQKNWMSVAYVQFSVGIVHVRARERPLLRNSEAFPV